MGAMMSEVVRLDDIVRRHDPMRPALYFKDETFLYGQVNSKIDYYNSIVQLLGVKGNVIVFLGNQPKSIFAMFGIWRAGCTAIPVGTNTKINRLQQIIDDSGAQLIFTDTAHQDVVNCTSAAIRVVVDKEFPLGIEKIDPLPPANIATILYTSGTSGVPKGVMCPPENMLAAVESINEYLCHTPDDTILTALPLSHGYGLYQILTAFDVGAAVILEPNFTLVPPILERMREATAFAAVPSMINMILKQDVWVPFLRHLRYITTAGAALPPTTFAELDTELPTVDIIPMYGHTEGVRSLYFPPQMARYGKRYNSCGIAIPGTTLSLIDDELVVEGPTVMAGYWNRPEETAKVFRNGKLFTGDMFTQDADGLYYYVGRRDDIVKIKGERFAPQELDNQLMRLDEVNEVASFTVEDKLWGNRVIVYIDTEVWTPRDIMAYCKRELEGHMLPKDVVIGPIPKTANGKISRSLLKSIYLGK